MSHQICRTSPLHIHHKSFTQGTGVQVLEGKLTANPSGANCCGCHKSSSQVDPKKNDWIKVFESFLCSIEQRVPMSEVLECSASLLKRRRRRKHVSKQKCIYIYVENTSLPFLLLTPVTCSSFHGNFPGVQTCRWGASPPNVGCSPGIRRSTSPHAMKRC